MEGESALSKVRRVMARRPQGGSGSRLRGIYYDWEDGDNFIRLVGNFLEVKTHFIAPVPSRSDRGLCQEIAFKGQGRLPKVINCLNWDVAKEEERDGNCPICRLHEIALAVLGENPNEEERSFFDKLRQDTRPTTRMKWNIVDRKNPYVINLDDGKEEKILGLKIATIGWEAFGDIQGIFEQCGFDIADPKQGIDIKVTRVQAARVTYSAQAVLDGTSLKVTPLTAEEMALERHDLVSRCGRQVEARKVIDALHEDIRTVLEANDELDSEGDQEPPESVQPASEPSAQPESAPSAQPDVQAAIQDAVEGDDDSLLAGTTPKA